MRRRDDFPRVDTCIRNKLVFSEMADNIMKIGIICSLLTVTYSKISS